MIMLFLTFFLSCSQLFVKSRFTGLSFVWRPLPCHSYGVGALYALCPQSDEEVDYMSRVPYSSF